MEDTTISYETAKLAKEKGFNIIVNKYYKSQNLLVLKDGIEIFLLDNIEQIDYSHISYCDLYLAPTQSLLQKWLREVHNIFITIEVDMTLEPKFCYCISSYKDFGEWKNEISPRTYSDLERTYELALEKGLKQALLLI